MRRRQHLLFLLSCGCLWGAVTLSAQKARVPTPGLHLPPLPVVRIERRLETSVARTAKPVRIDPGAQPKAWQYQDLALFCKLEVKMERAFRLPVRIRIGDVLYVDWLEGKRRSAY